ncbi:carbohydrate-binding protein [Halocella sp. SP3-1]|uniref:DUF7305 domain-containing protein n=1 Tax=Halocella sp. SP3-1 TaxID=2382161 RepID=UPI000F75D0B9|nr:carbohydrate-binding protein [Halocella sp. SP3-1]AZO95295.1 hypothetical protein D7D81_12210 [Halocella sp. SP3-1]
MYKFKNENGFTILLVMVLLVIVMVLGGALLNRSSNDYKFTKLEEKKIQSYFIAKSGADIVGTAIEKSLISSNELDGKSSGPVQLGEGTFEVSITKAGDDVRINSTGYVDNVSEKITLVLKRSGGASRFDKALYSTESDSENYPTISIDESAYITGPVRSNATSFEAINIGQGEIDGDLYIRSKKDHEDTWSVDQIYNYGDVVWYNGIEYTAKWRTQGDEPGCSSVWDSPVNNVTGEIIPTEDEVIYTVPDFPTYPDDLPYKGFYTTSEGGSIYENGEYNSINITSNRTLTIDLNNENRIIRVKNLNIEQGDIELINKRENGKLIFYVDNQITIGGDSEVNSGGNVNDIMIYYEGRDEPKLGDNIRYTGSFFTKQSDLTIAGSSTITGNIISGGESITIQGSASINKGLLYAPNAKAELKGSGHITGSAITKTISLNGGGAYVKYDENVNDNIPIDIGSPGDYERTWK